MLVHFEISGKNHRLKGLEKTVKKKFNSPETGYKIQQCFHLWSWLASGAPAVVWLALGAGLVTIFCPRMGHSKRNSDLSFKNRKRREKRRRKKKFNYLGRWPNDQVDDRICRAHWCDSTSLEAVHTGTWRLFSWLQIPPSSLLLLPLLFFLLSMLL